MSTVPLCTVSDTIIELAGDIARANPDCAEKAMQIADLARECDRVPDRATVQDALEANLVDTELSDPRIHVATSAVLTAIGNPGSGRV